jgi:hypothetical protein
MSSAADRRTAGHHPRRPLRVAPAWVGAARPAPGSRAGHGALPVREAVWIWSVRRFARVALWALPIAATAYGWTTFGDVSRPEQFYAVLAAAWLGLVAMVAIAALLAGSRSRRPAIAGLLLGFAGTIMLLPLMALPPDTALAGGSIPADRVGPLGVVAAVVAGAGWLLLGWAVLRSRLLNPADGILLMLAAVSVGAGTFAVDPLPTVGALLLLAAGMGLAWTGGRLIPPA